MPCDKSQRIVARSGSGGNPERRLHRIDLGAPLPTRLIPSRGLKRPGDEMGMIDEQCDELMVS